MDLVGYAHTMMTCGDEWERGSKKGSKRGRSGERNKK